MPLPIILSVGSGGGHHNESPATVGMARKLPGYDALKHTSVHFPLEQHTRLRMHAILRETILLELIRTVLEKWIEFLVNDQVKITRGEIKVPAVEDGRKAGAERGENQTYGVFVSVETHPKSNKSQ